MTIVGELCKVDAHAKIPALFMTMVCPRLYWYTLLIVNEQLSLLSDRAEHRIHPGGTTHHTHTTQSQMLSLGSPTKNYLPRRCN